MSIDNVKLFYEKLAKDPELRKKFSEAEEKLGKTINFQDDSPEVKNLVEKNLLSIARDAGYDFSIEDLNNYYINGKHELTDDMLNTVSGGGASFCIVVGGGHECGCLVGGGGRNNENDKGACACVLVGVHNG